MTSLTKPIVRKTVGKFMHYRKAVVATLLPGDVIALRLYGQRDTSAVTVRLQDLYFDLVNRQIRRKQAERKAARKKKK